MSSLVISGDTSGQVTLAAPAVAGTTTLTLQSTTGTVALQGDVIGLGQTYTNVNASRVNGTTYTNSTGKPITVFLLSFGDTTGQGINLVFTVNGVVVTTQGGNPANSNRSFSFIVPNGQTYVVSWNAAAAGPTWWELR